MSQQVIWQKLHRACQHEPTWTLRAMVVSVYPSCFASTKQSSSASHLFTQATRTALMGLWAVWDRMSCVEKKMFGLQEVLAQLTLTSDSLAIWKQAAMIWLRSCGHRSAYWGRKVFGSPWRQCADYISYAAAPQLHIAPIKLWPHDRSIDRPLKYVNI